MFRAARGGVLPASGCVRARKSGGSVLGGPGGDLLSRSLGCSTMGAGAFHGRVRDGIGCAVPAMATGPPGRARARAPPLLPRRDRVPARSSVRFRSRAVARARVVYVPARPPVSERCRAIRTARLRASLRFHLRPIDVVVFHGPDGETWFGGGFPA